jgi:DNA-binding transcriptional LysR family regulator
MPAFDRVAAGVQQPLVVAAAMAAPGTAGYRREDRCRRRTEVSVDDLYRLRYFVALATELNFTRAAARAHVTQQAMSRAISQLEREIGAELVVRRQRGCSLTSAGHLLLRDALPLLRQADALTAPAVRRQRPTGHLAVLVWSPGDRVQRLLAEHRSRFRDVDVVQRPATGPQDLLAPLLSGQVDAVVGPGSFADDADVDSTVIDSVPRVAVVPTDSEWAAARELTAGDLLDATFGPRHPLEPRGWEGDWNLVPERDGAPRRADFDLHDDAARQVAQVIAAGCVFTHTEAFAREAIGHGERAFTVVPMPDARPVEITVTTLASPRTEALELVETLRAGEPRR